VVVALVSIALLGACGEGGTGPEVPDGTWVELSGRVYTVPGLEPGLLTFGVSSRAGETRTVVEADGGFELRALVAGDTVDYMVLEGAGGVYHPSLVRVTNGQVPDLRFVLVPRRWEIDRGRYTGTMVEISPDAAFRPPCSDTEDINCDGFYPQVWSTGLKLWREVALPVPVAFDRVRSTNPIAASDSAAFWAIVERMNTDFGTPLFRPAAYEEFGITADGRAHGAVLVRIDNTLTGSGAWANWWWNDAGEMWSGLVRPRRTELLHDLALMTHELLHTQGFKHTCSWSTVMGGYGCSSHQGLSVLDVAHAHVAFAVHARQLETGAPHGLVAALQGERVITLRLSPFVVPDMERLKSLRMDGIADRSLE
jgi:hypothetical protein